MTLQNCVQPPVSSWSQLSGLGGSGSFTGQGAQEMNQENSA